ncbi:MAG: HAMP domain-containing sensor histidine kinase [Vicinamibacterales bacterium]
MSAAERERLRASLRTRASDFVVAANRDLTQAYSIWQVPSAAFEADAAGALADASQRAARETLIGTTVRDLFVVDLGTTVVQRLDTDRRVLVDTPWPPALQPIADRLRAAPPLSVPGLPVPPGLLGDVIDATALALVVPLPRQTPLVEPAVGQTMVFRTVPVDPHPRVVVAWLDRERLGQAVVGPLVQRAFGDPATSEFDVAVVDRQSGIALWGDTADVGDRTHADLAQDFLSLRLDDLHWARPLQPPADGHTPTTERVAVTIVRQGRGGDGVMQRVSEGSGVWTLVVRAKAGSLDAVVARSRTRNLALSLGILALLGASMALLLITSARAQRTAQQQLEFVASVSHELRTPLAVIRSAGDNLAAGVVSSAQVANYGALIRDEGRRLSEMVERVMDFAGMTGGASMVSRVPVDITAIVKQVVTSFEAEASTRGVFFQAADAARVTIDADPSAMTSALQNVIGNAVKYSVNGGVVDIALGGDDMHATVRVRDRGIGVDAADLPHVFEPFYRGRRAVDSQVRGSGVGLSVVRRIVEAHGGSIRLDNREGGGVDVVIDLPAHASDAGAHA